MKFTSTLAALGAAAMIGMGAGAAQADGHTKYAEPQHYGWQWYVELVAGGPLPNDYDVVLSGGPNAAAVYDPDSGFGIAAALGVYLNEDWRAEIAYTYATAGDGSLSGFGAHVGDVDAHTVLFNAYYEFDELAGIPLTPWVGAGLGFITYDYSGLGLSPALGGTFVINDSDTAFAGALHVGFDYAITENLDLTARYTALFVGDHDVIASNGTTLVSVDGTVENALFGGIKYKFPPM